MWIEFKYVLLGTHPVKAELWKAEENTLKILKIQTLKNYCIYCMFWDTVDFCQNNYFSGLQVLGHIKNLRKMGNFEFLSFETHQNFTFPAEILTPKMHAYTIIFIFFITQISKLSVSKDYMHYIITLLYNQFDCFWSCNKPKSKQLVYPKQLSDYCTHPLSNHVVKLTR